MSSCNLFQEKGFVELEIYIDIPCAINNQYDICVLLQCGNLRKQTGASGSIYLICYSSVILLY